MVVRTRTTANTTDDGAGQEGSKQLPEHLSSSHYLLNMTLALDVITIERAMRARATTKPWMRADVRALRICGLPMMAVLSLRLLCCAREPVMMINSPLVLLTDVGGLMKNPGDL